MTLQEHISSIIDNPAQTIDPEWFEQLNNEHPYFTLPAALVLQHNGETLTPEQRSSLMAQIALNAADKDTLVKLIDPDAAEWANFYPEEEKAPRVDTNTAIDKFIDTYGNPDPREEEILTRLIFNPTPDYAQILAEEEERSVPDQDTAQGDSQDAKINAFIIKSREQQKHFPSVVDEPQPEPQIVSDGSTVTSPEANDDSLLSESLAKIYIKQRRYSKAYEIIHNLSLNFPEKSIYFADQLRFLQKLSKIENNKKTS